ncbi:aa789383-cacc-409e-bf6c-25ba651b5baf-CDS [Sclerotinia trifoliorum]|uniref:Aa789383-cacc-409e-bf6c-25ba651b5baf-CDS n=1 Tax=Sclerotinia trifoliorum TaxID=28548 RepID=A0A8H2VLR3_9HELO|nr:aa789383-cacc-409e-bf6c-25ba651b5baf-CDS [Sclerotinia trifoliorum]
MMRPIDRQILTIDCDRPLGKVYPEVISPIFHKMQGEFLLLGIEITGPTTNISPTLPRRKPSPQTTAPPNPPLKPSPLSPSSKPRICMENQQRRTRSSTKSSSEMYEILPSKNKQNHDLHANTSPAHKPSGPQEIT